MTGYSGSRDYVETTQSPQKTTHRSTHSTEKQDSDPVVVTSVWVQVFNERVGVLFFSGMCGSVWGLLRRLLGLYIISRPGVPSHIYSTGSLRMSSGYKSGILSVPGPAGQYPMAARQEFMDYST